MKTNDKETYLIEQFRSFVWWEAPLFFGNHFLCWNLYRSFCSCFWRGHWIDSSNKNDPPPDFYNPKMHYMMEVMRVDDSAYVDKNGKIQNDTLKKENELLTQYFGCDYRNFQNDISCVVNVTSTLQNCSYERYLQNFKRVIEKHRNKIHIYQKNHPGYKTVFFIFDESSMYIKANSEKDLEAMKKTGTKTLVRSHNCFLDQSLLNIIKNCGADFVIWFAPYKSIQVAPQKIRHFHKKAIFDVKHLAHIKAIQYNQKMMTHGM